jgi:thymidylate kinase
MRIAVTGAQCVGKSTLVQAFKARWPMYKSPEKTYRELIKEKNISLNESGTLDSQKIIRDAMVDLALENAGKTQTIHDRCTLDNLAYTFWLAEHNKLGTDDKTISDFISTSILLTKESLKFYDIIFWLPINPNIPIEEKDNRSESETFREEINNIFYGIYEIYKKNTGLIFDKENQPAFIVLEGDVDVKLQHIAEYIHSDGNLIETSHSVLGDLENVYDELALKGQLKI